MPTLKRRAKNLAKDLLQRLFHIGQHAGFDLLPRHFYSSIPDFRELHRDSTWKRPRSMTGVAGADPDAQLRFAAECCTDALRQRLAASDICAEALAESNEPGYGPVDADFLFCFISSKRPRRVIQVGAGFSTAVMLQAARQAGHPLELTCVEPYPSPYLRRASDEKKLALVPKRAQELGPDFYSTLSAGDLLFIDSTHTVKVGSEVNELILEVLPRLPPGCYVHFHDVFYPYDYHRTLMTELFFPTESTLLHAFLIGNSRFSIAMSLSMLHYARPKELAALLPRYRPQPNDQGLPAGREGFFPSAIYLQVKS